MSTSQTTGPEPGVAKRTPVAKGYGTRVRRITRRMIFAGIILTVLAAVGAGAAWRNDNIHTAAPPPHRPWSPSAGRCNRRCRPPAASLASSRRWTRVELRAQVGGTLTAIDFQDGQIVHKGDLLFVIDPRPFQIRLDQAVAQLQTAEARKR